MLEGSRAELLVIFMAVMSPRTADGGTRLNGPDGEVPHFSWLLSMMQSSALAGLVTLLSAVR